MGQRTERPRCRRTAERRDELAADHSITSSAATSSLSGTVRPSTLAVRALMTNSILLASPPAGQQASQTKMPRYDRLPVRADLIGVLVKIDNPSERLLRRRDVVALGAEDDDGRADVARTVRTSRRSDARSSARSEKRCNTSSASSRPRLRPAILDCDTAAFNPAKFA